MSEPSIESLVSASLEANLIDRHSIDQDGSHVIVIGEAIHYLSGREATEMLTALLRGKGLFGGERSGEAPQA